MSLINKIKKYFAGIDSDGPGEDLLIDSDVTVPASTATASSGPDPVCLDIDGDTSLDRQKMSVIFDRVISVFNESLPDFLRSSIDSEKQRKYLLDSLDSSLKDYLTSVEKEAAERGLAAYKNERTEQKKMIETLRQRMLEVEKKRNDLNEQHLSDGRQKRALNERLRDLEKQILELEADREQLNIENKGLLNKIKVAGVLESDVEAMREEIRLLKSRQPAEDENNEEISRLTEDNQKLSEEIKSLKDDIARLGDEAKKKDDALQAVRMKDDMGEAMLNDLQKRASEAIKNLKNAEDRITVMTEEIAVKNAQIDDYKKLSDEKEYRLAEVLEKLAEKEAALADAEDQLAEAEENLEAVNEIAEQIEAFTDLKKKMDQRISMYKDEVTALRQENSSLKDTIQQNLFAEAQQNKSYQEEIDKLREGHDNNPLWSK